MIFAHVYWLLLLAVGLPLAIGWRTRTSLNLSRLPAKLAVHRWLTLQFLVRSILVAAVACVTLSLAAPQVIKPSFLSTTSNGRDIIFALDFSGSMARPFKGKVPVLAHRDTFFDDDNKPNEQNDEDGEQAEQKRQPRRIDAAQASILSFVEKRQAAGTNDAIALIAFDDKPYICWPLDRDLKQISRHGNFVPKGKGPQGLGGGTNFGTVIPGPIDAAAEQFLKRGHSKTRVFVLVTDGEDKLSDAVQKRLVELISREHIRFYIIGVGETLANPKQRCDILKVADAVGGRAFCVERSEDLVHCFETIDSLESTPMPLVALTLQEELFYIPLALGLALFLCLGRPRGSVVR